jgi:hypothetical protein
MIFPYYLTPEGTEILQLIVKAHFKIQENISWCSNKGYAGAIIRDSKTFFICTKNIFKEDNPNSFLNETVYHEAVHAAQICKGMKPIGIPIDEMPLSSNKMENINKSIALTKDKSTRRLEHEAYWLEDKPKETIKYLRKFCF